MRRNLAWALSVLAMTALPLSAQDAALEAGFRVTRLVAEPAEVTFEAGSSAALVIRALDAAGNVVNAELLRADLIARGVAEGYLAPRSPEAIERVLANAFGAFVEGRHLAGIGALLHWEHARVAEIASLYTVTRFIGEGIGGHLVVFACSRALELGCRAVTAVTTSDRVASFFERNGFERVPADVIPAEKWRDYDPERRARAVCLRRVL